MAQRPLSLILARNLLASISTPGFLVDGTGVLVFYNEAAGALLGAQFEQTGKMTAEEWGRMFGPFDDTGEPIPWDRLPLTRDLQADRPSHSTFRIRARGGAEHEIEMSALPLVTGEGFTGALAIFWPTGGADGGEPGGA